ncbi:hypothetical protein D1632_00130 [Chryseobacterium nematophagum]|uniref:DUF4325 domain-containing protein n=1 Tax=Chryseobacterium nematophagum TaxID=2305228 RepID=A0A3M7LGT8_9FLAO|nr:hypothetical protein D1632_00130 [Chryseobacterium nematophagum]
MIFSLPISVRSEVRGYNYLASLMEEKINIEHQEITFDFKNVRFFQANLCAFFGATCEYLESENKKFLLKY